MINVILALTHTTFSVGVHDSNIKVIQYVAQFMLEYKYQSFRIDSMSSEPYKKGQFASYTGFIIGLKLYHTLSLKLYEAMIDTYVSQNVNPNYSNYKIYQY